MAIGRFELDNIWYTSFDKTPKMSPYLLAIVISDYEIDLSDRSDTNTLVRVPGKFSHCSFSVKSFHYETRV